MAQSIEGSSLTRAILEEANAHLDEYKHIGPGPKAEQEVLWQRMKLALDTLHNARRAQTEEQKQLFAQNYQVKSLIYEALVLFHGFYVEQYQ